MADQLPGKRYVRGRIAGLTAEPGTILGPNDTGEWMVVTDRDEHGVSVGYAQAGDLQAALAVALDTGPRSVAEHHVVTGALAAGGRP